MTKQKDFVTEALALGEFGARSNSQKGKVSYRRFVEEGLLREIENPFEQLRWQTVLGDESFVRRLSDKLKSHRAHRREVTGVRRVLRATEPRVLVERVAKHYRIEIKKLLDEPAHGSEARNVAIWLRVINRGPESVCANSFWDARRRTLVSTRPGYNQ